MAALRMVASGLTMPLPAISGAEPCTGSNMEGKRRSGSRLALGGQPHAADDDGRKIAQDIAEQVGAHHHVEALRAAHEIHGGGVHQQRFGFDAGELRGHVLEGAVPQRPCCSPARWTW